MSQVGNAANPKVRPILLSAPLPWGAAARSRDPQMALHTTPGVPVHLHPDIAGVTAGSKCTLSASPITNSQMRKATLVAAYPRTPRFKEDIIQAL